MWSSVYIMPTPIVVAQTIIKKTWFKLEVIVNGFILFLSLGWFPSGDKFILIMVCS